MTEKKGELYIKELLWKWWTIKHPRFSFWLYMWGSAVKERQSPMFIWLCHRITLIHCPGIILHLCHSNAEIQLGKKVNIKLKFACEKVCNTVMFSLLRNVLWIIFCLYRLHRRNPRPKCTILSRYRREHCGVRYCGLIRCTDSYFFKSQFNA